MKTAHPSAFSLIELSIVLVIIGLLSGGVLAGRVLLRQSDLASVMTDVQHYISTADAFRQKYQSLPGDMPNATNFWGAAGGSAPYTDSCYNSTLAGTATCNGDGNGQIADNQLTLTKNEMLRVWQHLANAGFIKGSFTGTSSNIHRAGINCPASAVNGGGFGMRYVGNVYNTHDHLFPGTYGHTILFSSLVMMFLLSSAPDLTDTLVPQYDWALTGSEAQSLDAKFDDGLPATGSVRTWKKISPVIDCATASDSSATYTTASGLLCSLMFITGF